MSTRLCLFFLLPGCLFSASAQVVLPAGLKVVSIGRQVSVLEDTSNQLTITDLTTTRQAWQPLTAPLLIPGFTAHPVWIRFTLPPPPDTAARSSLYVLQLTNWYLDETDLYLPQPGGGYTVQRSGARLPFAQRLIKSRFPTFQIRVVGHIPTTYYVCGTLYAAHQHDVATQHKRSLCSDEYGHGHYQFYAGPCRYAYSQCI